MRIAIRQQTELPRAIARLAKLGRDEGFHFVDRLIADWESGRNCFAGDGEIFLGAYLDRSLVGVGGLNRDPYCREARVGRIRHVYLDPAARGRGMGGALVRDLVERARPGFSRLRLTTRQAADFYEHLGFQPVREHKATHVLTLGGR